MKIELREIDSGNRAECRALRVAPGQTAYIASNERSLQTAEENPAVARPFAIYADGEMVGFTMFAFDEEIEEPRDRCWLWRFMIDASRQGQGCGRAALEEIVRYFREQGAAEITLSTKPDNARALALYHRAGFRENGEKNDDEIVLKLPLDRDEARSGGEITLHEVTRELLHAYYRDFVSDPDIFMDMSRFFHYQYDPQKVDAYFAARRTTPERKDFMILRDGAAIGEISLKHIDYGKKECELSIHLQNDGVKNRGYGTQAEKLALRYAFEELGMDVVLADAVLKNTRSQHVLEKAGFHFVRQDELFKYYRCEREKE